MVNGANFGSSRRSAAINFNGEKMPLSQIEQSIIDIINGADFVSEAPTNGSDIIIGTDLADGVYLLDGDDIASGGLGNEKLYGGNGDDGILGGGGNAVLAHCLTIFVSG